MNWQRSRQEEKEEEKAIVEEKCEYKTSIM